jgi:C4-dicarboxylate transporter DctQ subunit
MQKIIKYYSKAMSGLEIFCKIVMGTCLAAATLAMIYQVILRYFFSTGTIWAEELARLSTIWSVLLGASVAVRSKSHLTVDFVVNLIHGKANEVYNLILNLTSITFFVILLPLAIQLCLGTTASSTAAMHIPYALVYICIPAGFVFVILALIEQLLLCVGRLTGTQLQTGGKIE